MSIVDPISDGPIEIPPRGFVPGDELLQALLAELEAAGVHLGAYDQRIARWVAGWDWMTVATIASWIRRATADGSGSTGSVCSNCEATTFACTACGARLEEF